LKISLLCYFFFFITSASGQKTVRKILLANHIDFIQINSENCFEIVLNTTNSKEVKVVADIEGEYSKDLDLKLNTNGGTLFIEAGFSPNFKNPNDKLSAHKVLSIALNILVPIHKVLKVEGTNSRVIVKGAYKELNIVLADGNVELNNALGDIEVKTQSGNIKVFSNSAIVKASSKYGNVSTNPIFKGNTEIILETITGNIDLIKTE